MANNIYSVSQINKYIAGMFKSDYLLNKVSVRGEIGTCTYQASGHIYFSIKDSGGNIQCVMWASKRSALKMKLETGMQVVVTGSIEVYEMAGRYQIIAGSVVEDGKGDIYERFEKLKAKLKEEGMFEEEYKRPIPQYVKTLGVVTAPTGAAVRDIIDIAKRRNPGIQIVLYPAIVQGASAPASIIEGIQALERYGVDCMIVGRGGGSMEDLWCFNDEMVAQAIFNCDVPVISAVGHETDFTIADFVSDLRAPTPSAAAELAVFDMSIRVRSVEDYKRRLSTVMNKKIYSSKNNLSHYKDKIRLLSPQAILNEKRNRLASYEDKLNDRMINKITYNKNKLAIMAGKLHGLSPLNKLGGGYAYVSMAGKGIKTVQEVNVGDNISINLTDGRINAKVTDCLEGEN